MSFRAYPSYRDSGVEWLGAVPAHWSICALNYRYQIDLGKMLDEKRVTGDHLAPYLRNSDVQWGRINIENLPSMDFSGEDLTRYSLRVGDLLVCEGGEVGRAAVWEGQLDGCFYQKALHRLRPRRAENDHARYLLYVFTAAAKMGVFSAGEAKSTIAHLPAEMLRRHRMCFPSLDEQVAIAVFLDRETGKIDTLIEEQRCLIALLREKRQAVISHAVTKGLDPHATIKDSGIEWLGDVPAHWTVKPLKRIGMFNAGAGFPHEEQGTEGAELSFHKVNALGKAGPDGILPLSDDSISRETATRLRAFIFPAGSIVFAKIGAALLLGRIRRLDAPACLDNNMMGLIVGDQNDADFVRHIMTLVRFDLIANPGTVPSLNEGQIANVSFAFPPPAEQEAIAGFLRSQLGGFDELMAEAGRAIQLLIERRAALISAAVTGKIDVRGSAKVLPFPIERARARGLVGTEIIERSAGQPTFGRVKLQKVAFLAEAHVGISELAGCYTRAAAGPLDVALIDEMEHGANSIAGIERDQPGGSGTTVSYRLGQQRGAHRQELADWLGPDRIAKLDKLIADFAGLTTKQSEAVATLYGVWNDALSEGASPTDDEIITGFLNDWHPEKREKFRASELSDWLGWMRRHGIAPTGSGPKTSTGRLFA